MAILADPVAKALIRELKSVISTLKASKNEPGVETEARLEIVMRVCELSRDARFNMGPPAYADPVQLDEVVSSFEEAVDVVREIWPDADPEIEAYCENILARARRCREI